MYPLQQFKLAPETEQELKTECNRLKNESHQRARDVIIRCAFILEELGYPVLGIDSKLLEDLSYGKSWLYEMLPEKYKRGYQKSGGGLPEPAALESPLLIAIHSVVNTADILREICNNLLKKLIVDKDKLAALQDKVSKEVVEQLQSNDVERIDTVLNVQAFLKFAATYASLDLNRNRHEKLLCDGSRSQRHSTLALYQQ